MKENKGKEVVGEGKRPEVQVQVRPTVGDKRKFLPKNIDLEGLPNRRDKRVKYGSSEVGMAIFARSVGTRSGPTIMGWILPGPIRNRVGYGFPKKNLKRVRVGSEF